MTGVQAAPAQLAALEAVAGALPRTPWQRAELPSGTWIAAPSADATLRWWWVASDAQLEAAAPLAPVLGQVPPAQWHAADLAAGIPWITTATQDVFIPQTVNLDLIQGVSFTKGCYPGQEVVARSHYRGTVKRRMAFGTIAGADLSTESLAGQDVFDATQPGEPIGRIVDASRAHDTVSVLFETTLAALPEGDLRLASADGPRIAAAPLPYSLTPDARRPVAGPRTRSARPSPPALLRQRRRTWRPRPPSPPSPARPAPSPAMPPAPWARPGACRQGPQTGQTGD